MEKQNMMATDNKMFLVKRNAENINNKWRR